MNALIVKLSSMGDVICTLPAVTDTQRAIDGINFDWVVEENFVEIPRWHSAVRNIIPINLRRLKGKPWKLNAWRDQLTCWQQLRIKKYDYILDAQGLLKSALVARSAQGIRCGFNAANAREPLAACFYKHQFNISKKMHAVERIRQLFAQALGYKVVAGNPNYGIGREIFRLAPNAKHEKYLVFVHGTSRDNKYWQEERWIELARLAQDKGYVVKLPWGNDAELKRASNIAKAAKNVEILSQLNLTAMGEIILHATGVVALDTGFSHLAAALGVPTVTLYGPTDPQLAGTYGENQVQLKDMTNLSANTVWEYVTQE